MSRAKSSSQRASRGPRPRARFFVCIAAILSVALSGCTPGPDTKQDNLPPSSFVFGTSADPIGLDPARYDDIDSARVMRQIFEGLTTADPNTGKPSPGLATQWTVDDSGKKYTFTLRNGVKFQDGTALTGAAVCENFNRWATLAGSTSSQISPKFRDIFRVDNYTTTQIDLAKAKVTASPTTSPTSPSQTSSPSATPSPTAATSGTSGQSTMIGPSSGEPSQVTSLFQGCTAGTGTELTLTLAAPIPNLLMALTDPAFSIASPTALKNLQAENLNQTSPSNSNQKLSAFALAPVGTGPYTLSQWTKGVVILTANNNYWGTQGQVKIAKLVTYDSPAQRILALRQGKIDGYDFVAAEDLNSLVTGGYQVLQRDPFSVLYMGMNEKIRGLDNPLARQAAAMAIDKEALVKNYFIDGSSKAYQFVPPKLSGFNNLLKTPAFDVQRAKELLKDSGYNGEPLTFYYPRNVSRPYMGSPEKIYADISANLTAVGFNIKPHPIEWSDNYLQTVNDSTDAGFYLLGVNGSYADPDNFLGPLFGQSSSSMGYSNPYLIDAISKARTMTPGNDRNDAYQRINRELSNLMPAVPLVFPISALTLSNRVASYPVSPVLNEVYNTIKMNN